MSGSSNTTAGQENVGRLLRRMTLASLGLDDLESVDPESRAVLQGADRFAARIDRHVQRLEHLGPQIRVLPGMPEFVVGVQERYVPMHVDPDFGLSLAETQGPRTHTDVGAWYKLLDAVHLVLFDEAEGDYVVKSRGVSRHEVRSAVAQMARRAPRPARSLFETTEAPARKAPRTSDVLSMSSVASRALLGAPMTTAAGRAAAALSNRLEQPRREGFAGADERVFTRADVWVDDTAGGYAGLPGVRALERAALAQAIVRRHDGVDDAARPDQAASLGTAMLAGLRSVRPVGGAAAQRGTVGQGARIGFGVERRLATMGSTSGDGLSADEQAAGFDPRVVVGRGAVASLAELGGVQREGYRYTGTSSGSLLAMVPESFEREALDALYARRRPSGTRRVAGRPLFEAGEAVRSVAGSAATVTPYPARMGRAGATMTRLSASDSFVAGADTAILRAIETGRFDDHALDGLSEAQRAAVRRLHARGRSAPIQQRLAAFARLPGASGLLFQSLADEPTARALGALASRGTSGGSTRLIDALLARDPGLPSSLGFAPRDLMAAFEGELGEQLTSRLTAARSYRSRYLGAAIDVAEPVRRIERHDGSLVDGADRARWAVRDARKSAMTSPGVAERSAQRLLADRASTASRRSEAAVYGDVQFDGGYLRGLTSSLETLFRSIERGDRAASGSSASSGSSRQEEATYARLDRMLSLVRAGGSESAALREAVRALQRAGHAPTTSRLAWSGEDPVLLGRGERQGAGEKVRRVLESGLRADAVASAVRQGVSVLATSEVVPAGAEALGRGLGRFADLARMFSLPRAAQLLAPELVEAARPMLAEMLSESIRGELRRHLERQAAVSSSRPSPSMARAESVARALGRPTLADADTRVRDGVARLSAPGALDAESAAMMGLRWSGASEAMRRLAGSSGADGRLELRTGFGGFAFDTERLAVSMRQPGTAQQRNALSLRHEVARSTAPATGARAIEGGLSVHLDTIGGEAIGATARRSERFEPRVLGLARFEERVQAELGRASGLRVLRTLDEEPRPIRMFSDPGEVVRVSYSPQVLARMVAAESRRREVLAAVTPEAIAAGRLDAEQRRAIARSVLGVERVAVLERLAGAPLTQADPAALMRVVEEARSGGGVPIQQLQGALREVLGHRGVGRSAIATELQRRIAGLDLGDAVRQGGSVGAAHRELEQAMDRFSLARASSLRSGVGYFESLLPGAFDPSAPSRRLAAAYGAPLQELISQRAARLRGASAAELRRQPIEELRLSGAALAGLAQRGHGVSTELRLRGDSPSGTYEVVRASRLSPILGRFAEEPAVVGGRGRAQFVSRPGEPGQLGGAAETFVPAASGARRAGFFSAQRALMEPVLAQRSERMARSGAGERVEGSARARPSVAESLEVLRGAGNEALLGTLGAQVASRMAEQGAPLYFVEAPSGLSEAEIATMFDMGSGEHASRRARRHDDVRMLRRVEEFLGRARSVSERSSYFGGSPGTLAAVARHLPSGGRDQGMPSWSGASAEKVRGVALGELREMLRQVGAVPVQGGQMAPERALVDPSGGAARGPGGQPAPLFSAREETMPSNQVRNREQATRTSDTGKPSASDLEIFANAVYDLIKERLRDQLFRARST